jgi:hypothetical protein
MKAKKAIKRIKTSTINKNPLRKGKRLCLVAIKRK